MEQGYVHIRQNSTEKDKLVVANICKNCDITSVLAVLDNSLVLLDDPLPVDDVL